ncbi:MAG: hypothetical protein ACRD5G_08115 [Candidatus Acidiferrales bacterium]
MFMLTQRVQAVLSGLEQLRVDLTTEEELTRMVPYLVQGKQDIVIGASVQRGYYAVISNESGYFALSRFGFTGYPERWWLVALAEWLGYRYFHFDAAVMVLDGRVSGIHYGISKEAIRPVSSSYIVSARSFHGLWAPYQTGFGVTSIEDESPQYRVRGNDRSLHVSFAFDAAPEVTSRAFQVELGCFWSLLGCRMAREIAPALWKGKEEIEAKALVRLQSGKPCPERILAGRARYLLDVNILLLEVTQTRQVRVNEEGRPVDESFSDFKVIETLRGYPHKTWDSMRYRNSIASPANPRDRIPNYGLRESPVGTQVLMFANHYFESCAVVPATASALAAVRDATPAPKRAEDERLSGVL